MSDEAAGILQLAAQLNDSEIDVMCHALGWDKPYTLRARRGLVSPSHRPAKSRQPPWRNYYVGNAGAWERLVVSGLAEHEPRKPDAPASSAPIFRVTLLGQVVARARWNAEVQVAELSSPPSSATGAYDWGELSGLFEVVGGFIGEMTAEHNAKLRALKLPASGVANVG
jgi:hypothetical protein